MSDELTLATDEERMVQLEACEKRIFSAFRRGLEATCDIGRELITIDTNQLYNLRGYKNLNNYAERELRMDQKAVGRSMDILGAHQRLQLAGVDLPNNESQLVELARLPEEQVVPVWEKLVNACDKKDVPVTVALVRAAVNLEGKKPTPKPGVKATLKMDEPEPLSEEGERALARIKRICGEQIAQAIRSGTRQLTERAIVKWADLKDQQMRNLVYYVIDQGWSVSDAILYEDKSISPRSTLAEMVLRTRAWGGHFRFEHEEFLITIDRAQVTA